MTYGDGTETHYDVSDRSGKPGGVSGFAQQIVGWVLPTTRRCELVGNAHPSFCEPPYLLGKAGVSPMAPTLDFW